MFFEVCVFFAISFILLQIYLVIYLSKNNKLLLKYRKQIYIYLAIMLIPHLILTSYCILNSESLFPFFDNYVYKFFLYFLAIIFAAKYIKFNSITTLLITIIIIFVNYIIFIRLSLLNIILLIEITSYTILLIFIQRIIQKNNYENSKMILYNIIVNFVASAIVLMFYTKILYRFGFDDLTDALTLFKETVNIEYFVIAIFIKLGIVPFFFYKFNFYEFLPFS